MTKDAEADPLLVAYEGRIARLTLNRPDRMNSLSHALKQRLAEAVSDLMMQRDISVVVLCGAGDRAFCAGADIKERGPQNLTPLEYLEVQRRTVALFAELANLPQITIAAIDGFALGGGLELALACDMRIASSRAVLGLTEITLGTIPAAGGTQRLARLIGPSRAKRMLISGARLTAEEALACGLVDEIYPEDDFERAIAKAADDIASKPPLALRMIKSVVDRGMDLPLHEGCALETQAAAMLNDTHDRREGMQAFIEKRQAKFEGR